MPKLNRSAKSRSALQRQASRENLKRARELRSRGPHAHRGAHPVRTPSGLPTFSIAGKTTKVKVRLASKKHSRFSITPEWVSKAKQTAQRRHPPQGKVAHLISKESRQRKAGDITGMHRTQHEMMASGTMAQQRQKFGFRKVNGAVVKRETLVRKSSGKRVR